jgi:hypothetical protein
MKVVNIMFINLSKRILIKKKIVKADYILEYYGIEHRTKNMQQSVGVRLVLLRKLE